jgi:hypothetical protein
MAILRPGHQFRWARRVTPLKHMIINEQVGGEWLELPGGGGAMLVMMCFSWINCDGREDDKPWPFCDQETHFNGPAATHALHT